MARRPIPDDSDSSSSEEELDMDTNEERAGVASSEARRPLFYDTSSSEEETNMEEQVRVSQEAPRNNNNNVLVIDLVDSDSSGYDEVPISKLSATRSVTDSDLSSEDQKPQVAQQNNGAADDDLQAPRISMDTVKEAKCSPEKTSAMDTRDEKVVGNHHSAPVGKSVGEESEQEVSDVGKRIQLLVARHEPLDMDHLHQLYRNTFDERPDYWSLGFGKFKNFVRSIPSITVRKTRDCKLLLSTLLDAKHLEEQMTGITESGRSFKCIQCGEREAIWGRLLEHMQECCPTKIKATKKLHKKCTVRLKKCADPEQDIPVSEAMDTGTANEEQHLNTTESASSTDVERTTVSSAKSANVSMDIGNEDDNEDELDDATLEDRNPSPSDEPRGKMATWKADFDNRRTPEGCILPTKYSTLKKAPDGTFRQPAGRCPKGMVWDSHRGLFAPDGHRDTSSSSADTGKQENAGSAASSHKRPRSSSPPDDSDQEESANKRANTTKSAASASSPRTSASSSSKSSLFTALSFDTPEAEAERKRATKVGSCVYAEWPKNGNWYWATVTAITKNPSSTSVEQYSLEFDDGDMLDSTSLSQFISVDEYESAMLFGKTSSSSSLLQHHSSRDRVCGACENCTKDGCGRCSRCRSSTSGVSRCCFKKMCFEKPVEAKASPAVGFPSGWRFYFAQEFTSSGRRKGAPMYTPTPNLWILSPGGKTYRSVEAAVGGQRLPDGEHIVRKFCQHVGLSAGDGKARSQEAVWKTTKRSPKKQVEYDSEEESSSDDSSADEADNFLVGRTLCFAWTNLQGRQKEVYGIVTKCQEKEDEVTTCEVKFMEESRAMVNAIDNDCGSTVPESQVFDCELAIGACMRYEEQNPGREERLTECYCDMPFYLQWTTPAFRHDELVEGPYGMLPRLRLSIRGFCLELNVKPSKIPGAGNGVFLTCTRVDGAKGDVLRLAAGELIDLGVYAPLLLRDKKSEASFAIKTFLHSNKPEEVAFDPNEEGFQYDITDDVTGELHAEAKKRIYAYANESEDENLITIHARHDPEGSVHYLLGHAKESQGDFVVPCNGSEIEVYLKYGPGYEKVRIRKGYSFCSAEQKESILEELKDEDLSDIINMNHFETEEVVSAANFLVELFSTTDTTMVADSVVERALTCAAVLRRRAQQLFLEADQDGSTEISVSASLNKDLQRLVDRLLNMVKGNHAALKVLNSNGNVRGLLQEILRSRYSAEQLSKLGGTGMIEME